MRLTEFFDYKNRLMEDMLTDEGLVKLLTQDEDLREDPSGLMYTQIFPYEYVPDTLEAGRTYICCDVDIQKSESKTFLLPVLYIWVFSHKSLLRLPTGGVRTDCIASEISHLLNGSRYYGLGELDLYSVKRFAPIEDYQGRAMVFRTRDFNRISPTGKKIPENRKQDSWT